MNEVASAIPGEPRLGVNDHGEEPRVESDAKGVGVHTLGDDGVDLDDAELQSSHVLVRVRESGLRLGTANVEQKRQRSLFREERGGQTTHMSSLVTGWRMLRSTSATSINAVTRILPTFARIP